MFTSPFSPVADGLADGRRRDVAVVAGVGARPNEQERDCLHGIVG
jgi:hypothetical protein